MPVLSSNLQDSEPSVQGRRSVPWLNRLALVAILFLASIMRFYGLRIQSLRSDEQYSRAASTAYSLAEVIDKGAIRDVHPPGFALFLHYVIRFFGDSETALRAPSAIIGVVAVYLMFRLGKSLRDERMGLYAAATLSVSELAVYHAQDCRSYSFLLAGTIGLALVVVRLEQAIAAGRSSKSLWAYYVLIGLMNAYLHYFGLLWLACVSAYLGCVVLRQRQQIDAWLWAHLALALGYLPWASVVITQMGREKIWMQLPTARRMLGSLNPLTEQHLFVWALLVVAGAVIAGWKTHRSGHPPWHSEFLAQGVLFRLVLWLMVPALLALGLSWAVLPVVSVRNFIILLPATHLIFALSLWVIDRRVFKGIPVLAVVVVACLVFDLRSVKKYYATQTKRQFRQAASYVWRLAQASDTAPYIVTEEVWEEYLVYYWRWQRLGAEGPIDESRLPKVSAMGANVKAKLAAEQPLDIVLIASTTKTEASLPKRLAGYRERRVKHFGGIDVKQLRRDGRD
jgi:uncharacterized membrane protein